MPRKLTSLERSKVALNFIRMNEKPELYVMDNRFLERALDKPTSSSQLSSFEIKKAKLSTLIDRLHGGYMPISLQDLVATGIA